MKQGFLLRVPEPTLKKLKKTSALLGVSINHYINSVLESNGSHTTCGTPDYGDQMAKLLETISKSSLFEELEGVILFGSVAKKTDTENSDIDLLLVMGEQTKIRRGLYRRWDEEVENNFTREITLGREISPHFVRYPSSLEEVHSLWLEVSMSGIVLWSKSAKINSALERIRLSIAEGKFSRSHSHGHPYWIRNSALLEGS